MNSERFNSALNEISDDLIDAAAGAYEKKANRKKMVIRVAWAACALLVLTAIGLFWKAPAGVIDPTQPTISMENPTTAPTTQPDIIVHTGNVYFLTATEERAELTPMQANMTLPWDHIFHVRSLKGMTEEELLEAIEEEHLAQIAFREKYDAVIGEGRYSTYYSENAVIRYYIAGRASLILLNDAQIESVDRKTTGVLSVEGRYSTLREDYTVGKGEYAVTIPGGSRRIYLDCNMTEETRKIFEENPETPLSTIRDTVTITINYKNGTKEIVMIDITVDDNGQIYMTQRGDNTGV
jgi:hypothetical protein